MNDKDGIRLAEAMGREYRWNDGTLPPGVYRYFSPHTDANDDYAVLEWVRKTYSGEKPYAPEWEDFKLFFTELNRGAMWNYRVGNVARAALKVLDDE